MKSREKGSGDEYRPGTDYKRRTKEWRWVGRYTRRGVCVGVGVWGVHTSTCWKGRWMYGLSKLRKIQKEHYSRTKYMYLYR